MNSSDIVLGLMLCLGHVPLIYKLESVSIGCTAVLLTKCGSSWVIY